MGFNHTNYRSHRQQGATLISLMIGMLISIVSALGILSLYKNLVTVSINATADASHDGQIATALMTVQLELQNAGYGIKNADSAHLNASTAGDEIRWRFLDNGKYQCRAIKEIAIDANTRALNLLEAATNCTATSDLSALQWAPVTTLTKIHRQEPMNAQIFNFAISTASCSPYGIGKAEKHLLAIIKAIGSADFHDASSTISATEFQLCLASTHPV